MLRFRAVLVFLCIGLIGSGIIYYQYKSQVLGVVSPLGENPTSQWQRFIFDSITTKHYPPNEFFPKSLIPKFRDEIEVSSFAYAAMERSNGELLLAKNLTQKMPIASVTKIMTAILALEKANLDVDLQVSSAAATIGEAEMGLTSGEHVRVEDLLYGLMLPSGNDAAEVLAEGLGGRDVFIDGMNRKAKSLGMADTQYFNPTGLDGADQQHTSYATGLDLLALTNYALQNEKFARIVSTYYKEVPYVAGKHKAYFLYNILQLDRAYPGIKGVKPGVTDFAGETLVSYAENSGKQIILVLLGSEQSRDDAVKIYDYIFPKLGVKIEGR